MSKLLLIDDDTEVLDINKKYLEKEGFEVKLAASAADGIKMLADFSVDCIILDIMMPGIDGFKACKRIKKITGAPIIFLTGRSFEEDKIKGLMLGADDYIIKPYSLRELSARIHVQIRRHQGPASNRNTIIYPPLKLNITKNKAYYNDDEILLSNREYELLYLLVSKENKVVTFEDIGNSMWGIYQELDRRTIMVIASRLRKKLEDYIGLSEMIETVWSKGYKFTAKRNFQ
jgi:DNA-binding response OmpR family regulator